MPTLPLVSVILPVYNVEKYIEKCLWSILNQTYINIELIVIDDGSCDRSAEIAINILEKQEGIKILRQQNLGLGEARNSGIRHASGEFVLFVDSDDWIEPAMVQSLVYAAMSSGADIVCCGYNFIQGTHIYHSYENEALNNESDYLKLCFSEVLNTDRKIITTAWAKLFRAAVLKENTLFFSLPYFEDTPFFINFVFRSSKIFFVKDTLYNYFVRDDSISNSTISNTKLKTFYAADDFIRIMLVKNGIFTKYKRDFEVFHLIRILLYGGFKTIYLTPGKKYSREEHLVFMNNLKSQEKFLRNMDTKGLTPLQIKLLSTLRLGLKLYKINRKLPNFLFRQQQSLSDLV